MFCVFVTCSYIVKKKKKLCFYLMYLRNAGVNLEPPNFNLLKHFK